MSLARAIPQINNIPRCAKWIIHAIKLNLLLPCFGLSALYLATSDPARRRPGITPPPYTKHVLSWSELVQFSKKTRCPFPLFVSRYVIILWANPSPPICSENTSSRKITELKGTVSRDCEYVQMILIGRLEVFCIASSQKQLP